MKPRYRCYGYLQFISRTNLERWLHLIGTMFEVALVKYIEHLGAILKNEFTHICFEPSS